MPLLARTARAVAPALALALVAWAAPAQAAMPTSEPSDTHRCANGKTARAWISFKPKGGIARLAADNPCQGQWLEFRFPGLSQSDPYSFYVFVAPGQRIQWNEARLAEWGMAGWWEEEYGGTGLVRAKEACIRNFESASGWTNLHGLLIFSDKDVRNAPECGQPVPKVSAARYARTSCHHGDGTAVASWKTDGTKIIKLAVDNGCSAGWAVAWWRLANGRKVAVWVGPGESTDLWKSELGAVRTSTKDGKVSIGMDRDLGVDFDDFGGSDPRKRPFYYNVVANGDDVT